MAEPSISTFSVTKRGQVESTYACFASWDLDKTLDQNIDRLRQENPIHAATDKWLAEMLKIIRVRFGSIDEHAPMIRLAKAGMAMETWTPILLWHICARELLLSTFLETWLYARKVEGRLRVSSDDVKEFLRDLRERGQLDRPWKDGTTNRMASGLPSYAADFGLLKGGVVKEIAPYQLPDEAILYVLHAISAEGATAARILDDIRWRRFLLSRGELEQELLRLHQHRKLTFEIAGSVVSLELPHKSMDDYVAHLVG
jgi:hypothetical protein